MNEHISIIQGYIDHLEFMKKNAYELFDRKQADKDIEAFKAAIKAIEQEPCEDAISRQAVIKCLEKGDTLSSIDHRLIDKIKRLPSVNPHETVTEFADRCRECGARYGKLLKDAISRQAAIEAIEEMQLPIMRSDFTEEQFVFRGLSDALNCIKDLPSVKPVSNPDKSEELALPYKDKAESDLIIRQEVLNLAKKGVLVSNDNYDSVCKAINALPSVNPTISKDRIIQLIEGHKGCQTQINLTLSKIIKEIETL